MTKLQQWVVILTAVLSLGLPAAYGQNAMAGSGDAPGASHSAAAYVEPEFVGLYRPDGNFSGITRRDRYVHMAPEHSVPWRPLRPEEVPPFVYLHPLERVVQDYAPAGHATASPQHDSGMAGFRDNFLTAIYGHERVLRAPTYLTTDSRQRLIVADPSVPAVHVLDGKNSFRIQGGAGHRIMQPNGVAVDSRDNIYVADGQRGAILVYGPEGQFVGYVGMLRGGENIFSCPTGIAIDRKASRLYVLDAPNGDLTLLDLQGNVLRRIGGLHDKNSSISFELPTEIALSENRVLVLDAGGSRVQILDRKLTPVGSFNIWDLYGAPSVSERGLAVDGADNIYVSQPGAARVGVYAEDGKLLGTLGPRSRRDDFGVAAGLWIDVAGRIYLADTTNSRILVFQSSQGGGTKTSSLRPRDDRRAPQ